MSEMAIAAAVVVITIPFTLALKYFFEKSKPAPHTMDEENKD